MTDHYQLVADTIQQTVLDSALLTVRVTQDGRELDADTGLYVLARSLDKAGLIDHRALSEEPCDECEHCRAFHADEVGACSWTDPERGDQCECAERWALS